MNRREFVVAALALVGAWLTGQRMDWRKVLTSPARTYTLEGFSFDLNGFTVGTGVTLHTGPGASAQGVMTGVDDGVITVEWT